MAPRLSKNQQMIRYLIERCGDRLNRTRLVKALFLADYEGRRRFGAPLSSYEYKYHKHGPWTTQIYEDVRSLQAIGAADEFLGFGLRGPFYTFAPGDADVVYSDLTPRDAIVLEAMAHQCTRGDLEALLQKVYATPPMQVAQKLGRGVRIPLEMMDTPEPEADPLDRAVLVEAALDLDRGLGEDFDSVLDAL